MKIQSGFSCCCRFGKWQRTDYAISWVGGFYRYTVDPQWKAPHFEKMLPDNAQLVELYLNAADVFSESEFEQIAYDTLDFMLSDMISPGGAFVAALSADDEEGKEGVLSVDLR
jgi:uncharacterized protein YyaL (SSP411 family)